MTAVEHFHARKFNENVGSRANKRAVLKVSGAGGRKKQKNPIKSGIKEVLLAMLQDDKVDVKVEGQIVDSMELSKEV
jgi:hypothetical protein